MSYKIFFGERANNLLEEKKNIEMLYKELRIQLMIINKCENNIAILENAIYIYNLAKTAILEYEDNYEDIFNDERYVELQILKYDFYNLYNELDNLIEDGQANHIKEIYEYELGVATEKRDIIEEKLGIHNTNISVIAYIDVSDINITSYNASYIGSVAHKLDSTIHKIKDTLEDILEHEHNYMYDYFTIESLENYNIIFWNASTNYNQKTISISSDNGSTWLDVTSGTSYIGEYIDGSMVAILNKGEKIIIKGENDSYSDGLGNYSYFSSLNNIKVEGNIMSLIDGDDFKNDDELTDDYTFEYLFRKCTTLTDAKNLKLPANNLSKYCYSNMFGGCIHLIDVPSLPAKKLAEGCYSAMFTHCVSLKETQHLPATTLAKNCYSAMFYNCYSLEEAKPISAIQLADYCCYSMFQDCVSLITAPQLSATSLAIGCYYNMFNSCSSLTTAPQLPATILAERCYSNMFTNCSSLVTAPQLPATSLADFCYQFMFFDCSSLVTAPQLPATSLTNGCYAYMFSDCTSLVTAPQLPVTSLATNCYNNMFFDCTALTTAPQLPATTLAKHCYYTMFRNCSSLSHIEMLATDISALDCLKNWVYGVAQTGTFIKSIALSDQQIYDSGIPITWTIQTKN